MRVVLTIICFLYAIISFAQVGIGTTNVDPSAVLEVVSSNTGVLLPKVNLSSTEDVSTISSPANGLIVFNIAASGSGETAVSANSLYLFNETSSKWERLNNESPHEYGDIKYGMQSSDHKGWVKLDGRNLTALSATQQVVAASLSFSSTLPDLTDKVLKQKGALGSEGGSNTISLTIAQENLPDVNFVGTTSTEGEHSHDVNSILAETVYATGVTSHSLYSNTSGTLTTEASGSHSHTATVSSGGSDTPMQTTVETPYFSANTFIYLGY